jgi:hypothetical protein
MGKRRREVWWLLTLEATLFLSLPFWESTAAWAEPFSEPFRFGISLIGAATVAMFACHIGPAALATKFGECPHHGLLRVLLLWLSFGYLAWMLGLAQAAAILVASMRNGGLSYAGVVLAFLVVVTVAAWIRSWWKPVAVGGFLLGAGILVWGLAETWHGLWTRNPHYSETPLQFDWLIIRGVLISAAPAVVVAWRIGCIESEPRRIWLGGLLGVWLPLIVSLTAASLAAQAGANLYWVPSLPRGFNWALLGSHGRLTPAVTLLAACTLLSPGLVSAVSLTFLLSGWKRTQKKWLALTIGCLFLCAVISLTWRYGGIYSLAATPTHQFWAGSLVILGAAAGTTWIVYPLPPRKRA